MVIVAICIVIIAFGLIKLFFGNGADKYGDRLNGIETVQISEDKRTSIKSTVEEDPSINNVKISLSGRIVYIELDFNDTLNLEDAKTKSSKVLENFSDEEQKYYDFNFTIRQSATETTDGFNLQGAKNASGTRLAWVNNNIVEEESE